MTDSVKLGDLVSIKLHDGNYYDCIIVMTDHEWNKPEAISSLVCVIPDNYRGNKDVYAQLPERGDYTSNEYSSYYDDIIKYVNKHYCWTNIGDIKKTITTNSFNQTDGCKCVACNLFFHMAEPNQPDNQFKCYSCKQNPVRIYY